ncbi:type II toxin-antitoxin system HicA family toxin [Micromonospora sp. URMC 103]|uniref:type II toxin-antitoxin system HicA family toxin n=1 Tax=Micromonospora sp. URMC 103 TaxID=3423406 RepID=UPI003F19C314
MRVGAASDDVGHDERAVALSSVWPSLGAKKMLRFLQRELGYQVVSQVGSHRKLSAPGRPDLIFSFHDRATVAPRTVRDILVKQAGLSLAEAEEVITRA